ncbi:MAG: hypothetical protein GTN78_08260 [Gemmatimonadales bacterium]|nr:hypothetical protein [Gemmatimonadales bacterium]NIN12893.1 hypothetical protein [Gemmatimonadales bacterium]NIR00180.1 hypothetical protein [Gemmatimonadales bacterium]NIS65973.1 hypothetical protein [Gemmatimonadales bacterium]
MRPSNPAMMAVSRSLRQNRDRLVEQWSRWVAGRMAQAPHIQRPTIERHLALLVDVMIEMAGPLRRQVAELWFTASDVYGHTAAARGLAAGEVVEELQQLRELLIHLLSEMVANLPPRQSMAVVLRLNRLLDRGIAHAVVGYTDALVETLLNRRGVPIVASEPAEDEVLQRLEQLEDELAQLRIKNQ